ncbi:hypothetical protein [Terriglobus saanensis]|uniref:Adenylate cyclase n=1 Tax=Terriglobus saanensis (strain ATCC BAA-1853 / DSM 23119 / SP1PR4) TaxID=401053 RepID=E8UYP2_TERSS|nr:hypothetical protein [Terriglobus saanensis]ADV83195.1 hypothetical protein AciPR4_2415 [Terriglobus saanensis SP1PR4]
MSTQRINLEIWKPRSEADRNTVLAELQTILASSHFSNSKRYPALLRYVVESRLAGKSDQLKERTLGMEVFQRPADYDTSTDTVVRYTAGEVRKRLAMYYHEDHPESVLQISLPAGSYVPEFMRVVPEDEHADSSAIETVVMPPAEAATFASASWLESTSHPVPHVQPAPGRPSWKIAALSLIVLSVILSIAAVMRYRATSQDRVLTQFWSPLVHDPAGVLICSGGSVFSPNNYSGVMTAGKGVEYPFISMPVVFSLARLSALLEHGGAKYALQASASTPLTDLRDRSVIMVGAYNNDWSLRLVAPLRFHFAPESKASIVDSQRPSVRWARDASLPYSSGDDYALVARFRDPTTGSIVLVLGGLGRNGTEAATQFVTTPQYLHMLSDRVGKNLGNQNIEVVLKTNVIEGKTGAPSIQDIHTW